MTEKNRLLLGNVWLIASLSALILPVFVPSYPHGAGLFSNTIEVSTSTMFILSLPSSLVALPFSAAFEFFGIRPDISGMYIYLSVLFVIGFVQWFWIVPRIWFKEPLIETLGNSLRELEPAKELEFHLFSSRDRTPVERILDEDRE